MANLLNRHTKQLVLSANTPDFDLVDWIVNPNITLLASNPQKYWVIEGNNVRIATVEEQVVIDKFEEFQGLDIDQVKEIVKSRINDYRENCFNTGVIFKGHLFDADARARENVMGICSAITVGFQVPEGFTWRSNHNDDVVMTSSELLTFGTSMMMYVSGCYSAGWYHKDFIKAMTSTDVQDYVDYNYQIGWPSKSLDGSTVSI